MPRVFRVALVPLAVTVIAASAQASTQASGLPVAAEPFRARASVVQEQPRQVIHVPKRIASDGSVNVTAALNKFINSVPNDSAIVFAKHGRYRIDGTILIKGSSGLRIRGNGSTLFARTKGSEGRRHVRVMGGKDFVIRNMKIVGANPNG